MAKKSTRAFIEAKQIANAINVIESQVIDNDQSLDELFAIRSDPKSTPEQKIAAARKYQSQQLVLFASLANAQKVLRKLLANLSATDFNPVAQATLVKGFADKDGTFNRIVSVANGNIRRRLEKKASEESE